MTPSEINLHELDPDEAHVARNAVASHRRNLRRVEAQHAFFTAVLDRYGERPNALRLAHSDDAAPVLVFGSGAGMVKEPMPDDLAVLYWAWKNA